MCVGMPPTAPRLPEDLGDLVAITPFIDVKNVFLRFFKFWSRSFTFLTFFYFPNVFYLKNVGKVQSGKQINKKHFQNNNNEIDLFDFFSVACRMT